MFRVWPSLLTPTGGLAGSAPAWCRGTGRDDEINDERTLCRLRVVRVVLATALRCYWLLPCFSRLVGLNVPFKDQAEIYRA